MGNLIKSMGHGFLYLYGMKVILLILFIISGAALNRFFYNQKRK
jgi:uncharacterized membrane protein